MMLKRKLVRLFNLKNDKTKMLSWQHRTFCMEEQKEERVDIFESQRSQSS
jgi:hypothetical protein